LQKIIGDLYDVAPVTSIGKQRHTELIVLLGAVTAFAPMSIDMYLPALPALGAEFGASPGHVQLSVASFFLGLAVGQGFYGPLSDRFGRTRPLYIGLALFVLASIGCALAPSIDFLIAVRFLQALGACSGQVIARAVVRDLFEPREAVQVFSLLVLVMGVSPVLAPLLGGQILRFFEWRAIFAAMAVLGAAGLVGTFIRLRESHLKERPPLVLRKVFSVYGLLITDRHFVGYVVTGGMAMAGMFAYIVGSPYVFIEHFHLSTGGFGFIFGINALGLVLAAQLNARLVRRFSSDAILKKILVVQVVTGLVLFAGTLSGVLQLYGIAILLFVYVSSVGCMFPNITAMAMAPHGARAGSASALIGVLQFALAAVSASLIGAANSGSALPMASLIGGCSIAAATIYWTMVASKSGIGISSPDYLEDR
jgi:DHA1 family bicyclomycin/chloramphenicol resistance-like MFS transporter